MEGSGESRTAAWLAVDVAAKTIVDHRWGEFHREDGPEGEWNAARAGDLAAQKDDLSLALYELQRLSIIDLDWEAEEPNVEQFGSYGRQEPTPKP